MATSRLTTWRPAPLKERHDTTRARPQRKLPVTMTSIEPAEPGIEEILRQYARPRGRFAAERWVRGFSGFAFAWPWFDGFSAWVLRRLYFPASRLWAAAQLAEGDPARFWDLVPMQSRPQHAKRLATALAAFDRARARANALDAEWQRVFFGPEESSANY